VESDEDSVEKFSSVDNEDDAKPAAIEAYDAGVDYGDDKFYEELFKIQDYYCEWRKNNVNQPVIDNSPSFVNECAFHHFKQVEREFDHKKFLYDYNVAYTLEDPGTHRCEIHTRKQPQINRRLFSAEQYFEFVVSRSRTGYCHFYTIYFGEGNILNRRVKFARDWIARNRSNYSFLNEDRNVMAPGTKNLSMIESNNVQTTPRNELSPLPWCIDRVADVDLSESTVPLAVSATALSTTSTIAGVLPSSNAKPPPNHVLAATTQTAQYRDQATLLRNKSSLEQNDESSFGTVEVASNVALLPKVLPPAPNFDSIDEMRFEKSQCSEKTSLQLSHETTTE